MLHLVRIIINVSCENHKTNENYIYIIRDMQIKKRNKKEFGIQII
jgi:hypothetical protein